MSSVTKRKIFLNFYSLLFEFFNGEKIGEHGIDLMVFLSFKLWKFLDYKETVSDYTHVTKSFMLWKLSQNFFQNGNFHACWWKLSTIIYSIHIFFIFLTIWTILSVYFFHTFLICNRTIIMVSKTDFIGKINRSWYWKSKVHIIRL